MLLFGVRPNAEVCGSLSVASVGLTVASIGHIGRGGRVVLGSMGPGRPRPPRGKQPPSST